MFVCGKISLHRPTEITHHTFDKQTLAQLMLSSKEFTVFAVDTNPYMDTVPPGHEKSHFDTGLSYVYDHLTNLLLKNRKIDRIGLVVHGNDDPIFADNQFTYNDLKEYARVLLVSSDAKPDFLSSVYRGLDLFKPKIHLKFSRNLVIVTNESVDVGTDDQFDAYTSFIRDNHINVVVVGSCHRNSTLVQIVHRWNGKLVSDVEGLLENTSILKKVSPRPISTSQLRFGADLENPDSSELLSINIQVYPATRPEKLISGHEYTIESGKAELVKRQTKYYVKKYKSKATSNTDDNENEIDENSDDENYEKVEVDSSDYVPAYKISKTDVQAVTDDLKLLCRLPTKEAIDILGFIKLKNLPYAYFVNESSYVLPSSNDSTSRNCIEFNSLAKTLIDFEAAAIVRYVPVDGKDISVAALLPNVVQIKKKFSYTFAIIQLAFKEDEKFGRFPWLTMKELESENKGTDDEDDEDEEYDDLNTDGRLKVEDDTKDNRSFNKREYPSSDDLDLMDQFVLSNDLDKDETPNLKVINNQKLALADTQFLKVPVETPHDVDTKLLASSPALQKFNNNIKKIIKLSLDKSSLFEFLNEDKFIEKYLVSEKSNLLNLTNIFTVNTDTTTSWLKKNNRELTEKIIDRFGVKYVAKSTSNKMRKLDKDSRVDNQVLEKEEFAEYFDVDDLLGN